MKRLSLFLLLSLIGHGLLFLCSGRENPFKLVLQRGETIVEVSGTPLAGKASVLKKLQPSTTAAPTQNGEQTSPEETSAPGGASPIASGVSDGSELGIPKPAYPWRSHLRGEQGSVLLLLKINEAKHLCEVSVAESSGFVDLDRAGLMTVKKALMPCEPDLKQAVKEYRVLFHFRLE